MDSRVTLIFNESILLERNIAHLYRLFSELFVDDDEFWSQLSVEEENHAALIHAGGDYFMQEGLFPVDALDPDLANLQKVNRDIRSAIDRYKAAAPPAREAYEFAMLLESSSGEYYFQFVTEMAGDSPALQLFRNLTEQNKNHLKRIEKRFKEVTSYK